MTQEFKQEPDAEQIAAQLGEVAPKKVEKVKAFFSAIVSLDAPVFKNGKQGSELIDFIFDEEEDFDETVNSNVLEGIIAKFLEKVSPREREILALRFGLDGKKERTLKEVGEEFGVSRQRIHQIETKALGKLRNSLESKQLADLL